MHNYLISCTRRKICDLTFSKYSVIKSLSLSYSLNVLMFLLLAGDLINCIQRMSAIFPNFLTAHLFDTMIHINIFIANYSSIHQLVSPHLLGFPLLSFC